MFTAEMTWTFTSITAMCIIFTKSPGPVSRGLMRRFQHFHEEGVDGGIADQFEEEEMLQTLQSDGAQGGQTEQQFGKPAKGEEALMVF